MFSATWFRVVIVVLVLGAIAAVSMPYVMDTMSGAPVASSPPPPKEAPSAAPVAAAPAPAAPVAPPATPKTDQPPAAAAVTKADAPPKSEATRSETTKGPSATTRATKPAPKAAAPKPGEAGDYWVQVGAFRDPATAKRVASSLKERGFQVAESTTRTGTTEAAPAAAPATADRYHVLVTGGAPTDIARKLTAKGLSAEIVGEGAVVQPSLPLREAVALSSDLRGDGFQVTVRRAGAGKAAAATPAAAGEPLHRVRVGAFGDRAAARAAVEKLEALGYKPFIAKGRE
jgi:cell division septation protein DedD